MRWNKISDAVVRRLPLYLRVLDDMVKNDDSKLISSQELGDKAGVGPALVRKDLAWFGEFGKQGVGYEVEFLRDELRRILNLETVHKVVLIGAGSLGIALARYNIRRFGSSDGFNLKIVGIFDSDPNKIGQRYEDLPVSPIEELQGFVRTNRVQMAILTVPEKSAQEVTQHLVAGGVRAILNFAPVKLDVPDDVHVASADLTLELQRLAYYIYEEE